MKSNYYAHTLPGRAQSEWQPLEVHLEKVAQLANSFAKCFGGDEVAYLAGLWHDIGKYRDRFQQRLATAGLFPGSEQNVPGRVDHSTPGALLAVERFRDVKFPVGLLLAYLIASHHTGLLDWDQENASGTALSVRLQKREMLDEIAGRIPSKIIEQPQPKLVPPGSKRISNENLHLWIRMLFSCLVDADFLDTESFVDPHLAANRAHYASLEDLEKRFSQYMNRKQKEAGDTPLNRYRQKVLRLCCEKAGSRVGFFSLTVPTGGGKTLSSVAFALKHALYHGKKRIIMAIPYTSIIEQTADVYRKVFGPQNVIEHHSNLDPEFDTLRNRLAAENWDGPIIVTTNVQLFESVFASRTSRVRKLHNLAESVIILDEAQMLPPEYLKPILSALRGLVRHFGTTVVLCTATQPALEGKIGSPPAQFDGLEDVIELVDDTSFSSSVLQRVEFSLPSPPSTRRSWDEVASELLNYEQVLCIVNSRKDCRELHALMPPGTWHLSGLMCAEDRSEVIAAIKSKLKNGEPIRVISTQLVEAGVDIDFPVVFRAMAGLDSLVQAAGRCNREGMLNNYGTLGKVIVFEPPHPAPPGLLRKGEDAAREVLRTTDAKDFLPSLYKTYFQFFYARVNDFDKPHFHDLLVAGASEFHFQFRSFAEDFHLVDDSEQREIIVWYKNGRVDSQPLIETLRARGPERNLVRKLQRLTVSVPKRIHDLLSNQGFMEQIHGYSVQAVPGLYCNGLGLLYDDLRLDPEILIQ